MSHKLVLVRNINTGIFTLPDKSPIITSAGDLELAVGCDIKIGDKIRFSDETTQTTAPKTAGVTYTYNDITNGEPEVGEFRLSQDRSRLSIHLTDATLEANDLTIFITMWGASTTTTNRGTLYFHSESNFKNGMILTLVRQEPPLNFLVSRYFQIESVLEFGAGLVNGEKHKITFSATGDTGTPGTIGTDGTDGAHANSSNWISEDQKFLLNGQFKTKTLLEMSTFTHAQVSTIWIAETDLHGTWMNKWLQYIKQGDHINIRKKTDITNYAFYKVLFDPTYHIAFDEDVNHFRIAVTLIASSALTYDFGEYSIGYTISGGGGGIGTDSTHFAYISCGEGAQHTNLGEIRATGNVIAYHSSDNRLKEITKINGVNFDWTDKYIEDHGGIDDIFIRKNDVGVIAQEMEEVMPEVVANRSDGYKAVNYEKIIALLIEGIKELNIKVNVLTEEVNELKNK